MAKIKAEASKLVLNELTGLKNVKLTQFKAYGSKDRTRNPKDVLWLERFHRLDEKKIDRIVTIAYLTLVKIDRRFEQLSDKYDACWTPVTEVKSLALLLQGMLCPLQSCRAADAA